MTLSVSPKMSESSRVYLDWNATAPLLPQVREAMVKAMDQLVGNASSIHHEGQQARSVVERARRRLARAVDAPAQAVVFTGGATESNNQILRAHARYTPKPYVLCAATEHPSVVEVVEALGGEPGVRTGFIPVDARGRLDLAWLERELAAGEVTLVSVMWANNETGNINPVEVVAKMVKAAGAQLHTDATQALGRIPLSFESSGADFMSLSFHKMGGPKGVGAVLVREGTTLEALLVGGHQERGRRPGTENVIAIAGVDAAMRLLVEQREAWTAALRQRRALLLERLESSGLKFELRGDDQACLPNTLNLAFERVGGEDLLLRLDLEGVSASSGSACTAGSLEPSHVLLAMGYASASARRSLRLSFGPMTPLEQIEAAATRIVSAVKTLESLGQFLLDEPLEGEQAV